MSAIGISAYQRRGRDDSKRESEDHSLREVGNRLVLKVRKRLVVSILWYANTCIRPNSPPSS